MADFTEGIRNTSDQQQIRHLEIDRDYWKKLALSLEDRLKRINDISRTERSQ